MPITIITSNHFKYQLGKGAIDLSTDTIKAILLDDTFVFDPDAHGTLADVSGGDPDPEYQIPTGYGYTRDDKVLDNQSFDVDDVNDRAVMTCDDISWTANGDDIGPIGALALIDTTTADDTLIGCATFTTPITISDGLTHYFRNIEVEIGGAAETEPE